MKLNSEYKSRFRILKGGKISLVVSALLVGASLSTPANALQVTGAEDTTQSENTLMDDLEVTSSGSITIVDTDRRGLDATDTVGPDRFISNEGTINVFNSITNSRAMSGIEVYGNNMGSISNSNIISVTNTAAVGQSIAIKLNNNSGDIDLGGSISSTARTDAYGLIIIGDHTGTITNSSNFRTNSTEGDAFGTFITGNMTNASILSTNTAGTYFYTKGATTATGILVNGTTTDSNITNTSIIETVGETDTKSLYFKQGLSGTTTITTHGLSTTSNGAEGIGIHIRGDSTANAIINNGIIQADARDSYGILIDGSFTGDIINNSQIINFENSGKAKGIVIKDTFTGDLTNNLIDVKSFGSVTTAIEISEIAIGSTVENLSTIKSRSLTEEARGIDIITNHGSISNNGGLIGVSSRDSKATGIHTTGESTGTITNSGTIIVESTNSLAYGIKSLNTNETINTEITNSDVIFAHKGSYELDWKAFALFSDKGDVNNTNRLHGNMYVNDGTLTNLGEILLPHNAYAEGWAWADNFTNQSTGTLTIGLQTDGTTITRSQLAATDATFEDGSTINVDVTSASENVGSIVGETLDDVVWTRDSLTIGDTINVTDNSDDVDFEAVIDGKTIDLKVIAQKSTPPANNGGGGGVIIPTTPTPTPTEPDQIVDSDADEAETGINKGETQESDDAFTLEFEDENGEKTEIVIPKPEGKTILINESSQATEFQMGDGVASYNNNGTTEHVMGVDNKETIAISYIPGAKVEFRADDAVQTSVEFASQDGAKSDILIVATKEGFSQNSVKNADGVSSKADSTIIGTKTEIQEDGKVVVDTPTVLSDKGNEITTKTTLDADGNAVVSAVKILPDGTQEEVALGGYPEGSQVKVQHIDGTVVVEVITSLGTESFTLRSGRR